MEEHRLHKVRQGGAPAAASALLLHVTKALSNTEVAGWRVGGSVSAAAGGGALPHVQVQVPVEALSQARAGVGGVQARVQAGVRSEAAASPLFAGTPTLRDRKGMTPKQAGAGGATPRVDEAGNLVDTPAQPRQRMAGGAAMTPHRLVARQSDMQSGMLMGQPSPYVGQLVLALPFSCPSCTMALPQNTTHFCAVCVSGLWWVCLRSRALRMAQDEAGGVGAASGGWRTATRSMLTRAASLARGWQRHGCAAAAAPRSATRPPGSGLCLVAASPWPPPRPLCCSHLLTR
jgi:hypothetical protein